MSGDQSDRLAIGEAYQYLGTLAGCQGEGLQFDGPRQETALGADPMKRPVIAERKLIDAGVRTVHEPQPHQAVRNIGPRRGCAIDQNRVATAALRSNHHAGRHDQPAILELPVLNQDGQIINAIVRRQSKALLFLIRHNQHAREPRIDLLTRQPMRMRVIEEGRRRLADRQRRTPGRTGSDQLVRATVQFARHEQPVPVNRCVSRQAVADGHRHIVAAVNPQRRAEIATIVPERGASPAREERGLAFLCSQVDQLAVLARVDQARDRKRPGTLGRTEFSRTRRRQEQTPARQQRPPVQ